MNAISINASFVFIYTIVFIWQCVHCRQWVWLISSVAIWMALNECSIWLLPGLGTIPLMGSLFLCHFYVFAGSMAVLFFRQYSRHKASVYLELLLQSSVILHVSWLILIILAWWQYPNGLSLMFANGLIQMYLWQPAFWLTSQWLLMLLWWLAGVSTAGKDKEKRNNRQSWQVGLLLALLWQAAYGFALLLHLV